MDQAAQLDSLLGCSEDCPPCPILSNPVQPVQLVSGLLMNVRRWDEDNITMRRRARRSEFRAKRTRREVFLVDYQTEIQE